MHATRHHALAIKPDVTEEPSMTDRDAPDAPDAPDAALLLLEDGNRRFLSGDLPAPDVSPARRLELARGQKPFCAYLTCSDSRVPPELLFGRGLGELFIVRNAGNTLDTVAMGSIEFAVAVLGVPLVVVMGHQSCGAVEAAIEVVERNTRFPGTIDTMIEPIVPAVLQARAAARSAHGPAETGGSNAEQRAKERAGASEDAVRQNVRRQVETLRHRSSSLLTEPQAAGTLKVVGAYYDLERGAVDFFDRP